MIEYRYASDEHRRDVIDFINYVFSQAACPHDFKTLIPKVYADGRGYADIHAIVLEDNYVRGVVAQLPNEFTYGGKKLKTGYIGSVSTYKYSRGSGYMIKLMEMQAENAVKQGIDVMLLGGQRQRYEYYGYSPIGGQYRYDFVHANIRHGLKDVCSEGIEFIPFKDACSCEIDCAYAIYEKQPVTGGRPREDFEIILSSWNSTPYIVKKDGEVKGYIVSNGPEGIGEMTLSCSCLVKPVIKAWFERFGIRRLSVVCASYDAKLNRELASFSESYNLTAGFHAWVVNLKNVLEATMALKKETLGLKDGEMVLQMDEDTPLLVKVENGEIIVSETNAEPTVKLDRLLMQQFLFGYNRFTSPDAKAPEGWLPLPLHLYGSDHF